MAEPAAILIALLYALIIILVVFLVCYLIVRILALFEINGTIAKIVYLIGGIISILILLKYLLGVM